MGFFGAIKVWCAKYDLDRCDSFGSIPRILKTVEDHKGTEGSSKIEDLALSKLLAMKMGETSEDLPDLRDRLWQFFRKAPVGQLVPAYLPR
jgi:hypothetical protein